MDLKYQPRLEAPVGEALRGVDHRELDDVGGGALNGHIHRHALLEVAHDGVFAVDAVKAPAASERGARVAGRLRGFDAAVEPFADFRVGGEVVFDIFLRVADADFQVFREGERAHAVDDAEVYRLRAAADNRRDHLRRNPEDAGGGLAVEIVARKERRDHVFVAGKRREQAQLDLRVVGVDEHAAVGGAEEAAHVAAELGADGYVLQVRLARGDAPGARFGLQEGRVDAAVFARGFGQSDDVGGDEFRQRAVFEHEVDYLAFAAELAERFGVGGPAGLGFLAAVQPELVEEHVAELLGGVDVEFASGERVYLRADVPGARGKLGAERLQSRDVDGEAGALHIGQHPRERELHIAHQRGHAVRFKCGCGGVAYRGEYGSACRGVLARRARNGEQTREREDGVVAAVGIEQITAYRGAERRLRRRKRKLRAPAAEFFAVVDAQPPREARKRLHRAVEVAAYQRRFAAERGDA